MDRLWKMLTMMFVRRAVNRGIRKGINTVAGSGKRPADMTPEERVQARNARQLTKRARQAARITRRLGR
jgi:hypothetical protein